ncbi:MAG: ATP-binding protein [Magnetococcales bacterium]|nr:ATP-binding protein [Magnetococcales bacterium]
MAVSLNSLQRRVIYLPPRILLYGVPGVGKSTFAARAPRPVFIITEDGLGLLQVTSFPLASTYDDVMGALDCLINEQHDFESVVLDSLDWLEPLIWAKVCQAHRVNSIEELGYGKGYVAALDYWRSYLDRLNRLRSEKSMVVVQVAHSTIRRFDSPEHEPFDRYDVKLHQKAAALVQEYSDCVLFANYKVFTTKADVGFGQRVNRAVGNGERLLFTQERPAFLAKNRYGLPPELPLDWNLLQDHLTGSQQPMTA